MTMILRLPFVYYLMILQVLLMNLKSRKKKNQQLNQNENSRYLKNNPKLYAGRKILL